MQLAGVVIDEHLLHFDHYTHTLKLHGTCAMHCVCSTSLPLPELPYPPEGFRVVERGDQNVRLEWSPAPSDTIKPVAEYVLELVYTEERGTVTATRVMLPPREGNPGHMHGN